MPADNSQTQAQTPDLAAIEASLQAEANLRAAGIQDTSPDGGDDAATTSQVTSADDSDEVPVSQQRTEAEARRKGWLPKDEYKGPGQWVDAKTFLERGERFNANLQRELAAVKDKLGKQSETFKKLAAFYQETLANKERELQDAIAQLRVQRSQAQADGDHDVAVQLEDRIDLLKEEAGRVKKERKEAETEVEAPKTAQEPTPEEAAQHPVVAEWIEDGNTWFRDNSKLRDYALQLGEEMLKGGETARGRKFLDKVAERMREEFPRTLGGGSSPPRQRTQAVESSDTNTSRTLSSAAGKTERDLPEVDRRLMNEYVRNGWMTKEAFLKSYFSR